MPSIIAKMTGLFTCTRISLTPYRQTALSIRLPKTCPYKLLGCHLTRLPAAVMPLCLLSCLTSGKLNRTGVGAGMGQQTSDNRETRRDQ